MTDKDLNNFIDIAINQWCLSRLFSKAVLKLDKPNVPKFSNQHNFYKKQLENSLSKIDIELDGETLNGEPYDPGHSITPINISSFSSDDILFIDKITSPIVIRISDRKVLRFGKSTLRRKE